MKKIISLIAALTMAASLFTVAQAADPIKVTMDVTGGTKAGEKVTVTVNYSGANAVAYDEENTGDGDVLSAYGVAIKIPGGIAASGEQFKRAGAAYTNPVGGTASQSWDLTNDMFILNVMGGTLAGAESGTLCTFTMTLSADIPDAGLAFTFVNDASHDTCMQFAHYAEWTATSFPAYYASISTLTTENPAVYGAAAPEPEVDSVVECGVGKDAEENVKANYYTVKFVDGVKANAQITVGGKDWKITDVPAVDGAAVSLTWVFNGKTDAAPSADEVSNITTFANED